MRHQANMLPQVYGYLHRLHAGHLLESAGNQAVNIEQAITLYQEALRLAERAGDHVEWARIAHRCALAYAQRHYGDPRTNYEHAITLLESATAILTRAAYPTDRGLALVDLAQMLAHQHQQIDSRIYQLIGEAIDIATELQLIPLQMTARNALAQFAVLDQRSR